MADFRIFADIARLLPGLAGKLPEGAALDAASFPSLQEAVREAAEAGRARWRAYAAGAPLPSGHAVPDRHREAYAASIGLRQTGDFSAEIFTAYDKAEAIEDGEPARDLKDMLWKSRKVRRGKRGRYLIIPFRWSRPPSVGWTGGANEMGHDVAHWWSNKKRSTPGGERGAAFKRADALRLGHEVDAPGKGRNQVGMLAYRPEGARRSASNTTFMTFRTMGEWQDGQWIVPAKPALPVSSTVAAEVAREALPAFREAAAEDLGRMTEGMFSMRPGGGGSIRKAAARSGRRSR